MAVLCSTGAHTRTRSALLRADDDTPVLLCLALRQLTPASRLLRGGVPTGSLTELTGESTVGKTQLCLQLLLTAQLPVSRGGLGGRSLYIHTEGQAPLSRLAAIAAGLPHLSGDPCDLVLVANATAGPEQLLEAVQQARWHVACFCCARTPDARTGCCAMRKRGAAASGAADCGGQHNEPVQRAGHELRA